MAIYDHDNVRGRSEEVTDDSHQLKGHGFCNRYLWRLPVYSFKLVTFCCGPGRLYQGMTRYSRYDNGVKRLALRYAKLSYGVKW